MKVKCIKTMPFIQCGKVYQVKEVLEKGYYIYNHNNDVIYTPKKYMQEVKENK